ncbi:MAG: RNA methyltransferase [Flavobacteriales bacterium]
MANGDRKLTMDELGRVAPEVYVGRKQRVRVVLDDVRSRHNVGSIFRTADGFGIEGIILCGFTPTPPHREIEKTALGATASVPWEYAPDAVSAIARLRSEGYRVLAVEQTLQALPLQEVVVPVGQPVALVFGNELHGVSDRAIAVCDGSVVVPQHGSKHSLNISVCAGVVLWWLAGRVD